MSFALSVGLPVGAVIGSFLNVVIARLPTRENIVTPPSRCPRCRRRIRWFDNLPVVSFAALRGRCRDCRLRIAWRYPTIEALTALLFAAAGWRFGWRIELLAAWAFIAALITVAAIDIEHEIIPDVITLPGVAIGLAASLVDPWTSLTSSIIGTLAAAGFIAAVMILSVVLLGREGMGGGDLKLSAMIGAFLGWKLAALTLFLAVVLGGLVGGTLLITRVKGRKDRIPFGPFLSASAIVSLFVGDVLLAWYFRGFL